MPPRLRLSYPKTSLILLFIVWKALLLLIACTSPHPGYDTSTTLLAHSMARQSGGEPAGHSALQTLANQLTRWDAIYFTNIAHRGALFEQEWAFGWGYARFVRLLAPCTWSTMCASCMNTC